uniref:WD repeat-containing protein 55 homolog n=1 Tax=Glossina morsitans morsitans TaxID=37546 RepID=A0A1B0G1K6_GLOMM
MTTSDFYESSLEHLKPNARRRSVYIQIALNYLGYKYVACRGNDNLVNVWTAVNESGISTVNEALRVLNKHQTNVLSSGGGTVDRCIKFWNFNNGSLLTNTKSQVCGLWWSCTYKELISAHGLANNQLTIWKYPSKVKQTQLDGRTSRVLQLTLSLDGSTVISAVNDFWYKDCFP